QLIDLTVLDVFDRVENLLRRAVIGSTGLVSGAPFRRPPFLLREARRLSFRRGRSRRDAPRAVRRSSGKRPRHSEPCGLQEFPAITFERSVVAIHALLPSGRLRMRRAMIVFKL